MAKAADDFRRQINDIWKQASGQLEEVKDALLRGRDRVEDDLLKLRNERDRLLKRLGEQTRKVANQGKAQMPTFVTKTVDNLNEVIDRITKKEGKRGTKKRAKKKTAKKATKKASAKKTTKKKTAKKAAKKKSSKKASKKRK